jgi:hypothetical protein
MALWARRRHGVDGVTGSRRMMALWAQGRHVFDDVVGSGRLTVLWDQEQCGIDGIMSLGMAAARSMVSPTRGWGRRWRVMRARPRSGMMAWRLQGGLDDNMGSGEVEDSVDSREIFDGKFWQPNGVS